MKKSLVGISFLILLSCFLLGCSNNSSNRNLNQSKTESSYSSDSIELTSLIRIIYKWHEEDSVKVEFKTAYKDSIITGIDWNIHKNRMNQLSATNFFAQEFLDNYNSFALQVEEIIMNNKRNSDYLIIAKPIEDTHDMWTNFPWKPENYWETLTINNLINYKDSATFKWTWGYNHYYSAKALKVNEKWKISYLEGFKKFDLQKPSTEVIKKINVR